jgi:uncharacterized coiled-coil protein SlyX
MKNNTTNKTEIKAQKVITVSELENQITETETFVNNLADELFRLKERLCEYDVLLKTSDTARGKWRKHHLYFSL